MPTLRRQSVLQRRSQASSRTFSIVFAVIALFVVPGCLIWGFLLPKFRKKSNNYSYDWERGAAPLDNHDRPQFPSHPALLRDLHKKGVSQTRHYNPRIESPFPSLSLLQKKPTIYSSSEASPNTKCVLERSHGVFSPPKDRLPSRHEPVQSEGADMHSRWGVENKGDVELTAYNHDHDYILPVPVPLVLKPRPAGRPPPLNRQLERFPVPIGTLRRKNGLLHPAKLFQNIETRDSQSTSDPPGTPSPAPCQSRRMHSLREGEIDKHKMGVDASFEPIGVDAAIRHLSTDVNSDRTIRVRSCVPENSFVTQSGRENKNSERAGTVTRLKTPVAETRELVYQASTETRTREASLQQRDTPSTNPFDNPAATSTPPTSPLSATDLKGQPSTPPGNLFGDFGRTPSSAIFPSPGKLTPLQYPLSKVKGEAHSASKRSKSAHLNLCLLPNLRGRGRHTKGHSLSSLSTILKPIIVTRSRHSHRASSIYSRDTKGISHIESLVHDEFLQDHHAQPAPYISEQKVVLMDTVKSKIDEWDLHTGDLDASAFTPKTLKRTLSDFGPRGASLRDCPGLNYIPPLRIDRNGARGTEEQSVPAIRIGHEALIYSAADLANSEAIDETLLPILQNLCTPNLC